MFKMALLLWFVYVLVLNAALWRKPLRGAKAKGASGRKTGEPWRLLIIGATGGTGRELVRQALEQGHYVTALVRTPAKVTTTHPRLTVLRGDVRDRASVDLAMLGQEAVLSALGHTKFFQPTSILSEGTLNILRAMKSCAVRRFVCESSLGVGDAVGRLGLLSTFLFVPMLLHLYFWDRKRQENLIERSTCDWVVVRPTVLTNGAFTGRYRHGAKVGNYVWGNRVSRADVADFMLKQVCDDAYVGAAVGVV